MVGFASVLSLVRKYSNALIAEIHQLCYGGVVRSVALCVTEGLSSWRCSCIVMLQSLTLPVGKIALGRIINVVGSVIDRFLDLDVCGQYYSSALALSTSNVGGTNLSVVEPSADLTFCIGYPHMKESIRLNLAQPIADYVSQFDMFITMQSVETVCYDYAYYVCYLYASIPASRPISLGVSTSDLDVLPLYEQQASLHSTYKCDSSQHSRTFLYTSLVNRGVHVSFGKDKLFSHQVLIHRTPLALISLSVDMTLFETGIKVLDLLTPYKKGGKIGLFGGAGVGKTVVIMELIRN
jgi:hypothetical protein